MSQPNYYNSFYKQLAEIDRQGSDFNKISDLLSEIPLHGLNILDIGSGFGQISKDLVKLNNVYANEYNLEAQEFLRTQGYKIIETKAESTIICDNSFFDIVLILDVLEHLFSPELLLAEAFRITKPGGIIVVTIPLYFDLIDRIRILFSGKIVSYDNQCYGTLAKNLKSYNYDHIRFFKKDDFVEMVSKYKCEITNIQFTPCPLFSFWQKLILKPFINKFTAKFFPNLFAHGLKAVIKKL